MFPLKKLFLTIESAVIGRKFRGMLYTMDLKKTFYPIWQRCGADLIFSVKNPANCQVSEQCGFVCGIPFHSFERESYYLCIFALNGQKKAIVLLVITLC